MLALFSQLEAALLWAMADILSAIYVIVTLILISTQRKEIFRLFHDFWDRFIPAIKRGENVQAVWFVKSLK